jgi:hypothetical protein
MIINKVLSSNNSSGNHSLIKYTMPSSSQYSQSAVGENNSSHELSMQISS